MGSYADLNMNTSSYEQTPSGRFRRASNLTYLHPGSLRNDLRAAPRPATRSLLMVIPPLAVSREYESSLFLNASTSTSARASHAFLMPLLSSLSGQLSALAREFSFPSTTGIHIYLRMADGGMEFAPRISDESWSILWGSAFDERPTTNGMGGLPIAGRIEFDLDLRKARWFDMWVTACRREIYAGPSAPASVVRHRRDESRTTYTHEPPEESTADDHSVTIQQRVPVIKHVPRKLSLLDRVDVSTLNIAPRPISQNISSPTRDDGPRLLLSPVAQTPTAREEESQTEVQRVGNKVEKWRASSSFAKSPLATNTGQTALDPANMPNNLPLVDSDMYIDVDGVQPLNLDDFTWSISSAGPPSADFEPNSPPFSDWDRVTSVHLDRRLEGSVCLTPTTCTSLGPSDYNIDSPVSSLISRLPSPDIAERYIDYAPLTPSTATSWGPPSEWPSSPASSYRAPSVDIAARQIGSRPVTPSTATSWGAPLEWPPSPVTPSYVPTPGIGSMFFDDGEEEKALLHPGRALRSYGAGAGDQEPWKHVWSYNGDAEKTTEITPWKFVWPYRRTANSEGLVQLPPISLNLGYPWLNPYPAAYPHFDLYPVRPGGLTSGDVRKHGLLSDTDDDKIVLPWNHVWPYQHVENAINPIVTRIDSGYPSIVPYPVAYPHFDLYPVKLKSSDATRGICIKDSIKYPIFSIYSAVNPAFEVYPGNVIEPQENSLNVLPVKLPSAYPSIEIYSPVYPHLVIYPAIVNSQFNSEWSCAQRFIHMSPIHLSPGYPWINIYSAVYPHFDLYPVRPHGFNKGDVLQRKSSLLYNMDTKKNISAMPRNYVCQHAQDSEDVDSPIFTRVNPGYSSIEPYPAAYPNFDLYHVKLESSGTTMGISIKVDVKYPNFDPATYPTFEIYPGYVIDPQENSLKAFPAKLPRTYPSIEIYPAVYPDFNIYPAMTNSVLRSKGMFNHISQDAGLSLVRQRDISVRLECFYPIFNLYPAMYPNNLEDIYPCVRSDHGEDSPLLAEVKLPTKYPYFNIYPATYPSFNFYPNIQKNAERYWEPSAKSKDTIVVTLKPKYPHIELYTPVYPHLSIYPAPPSPLSEQTVSVICETRYPNFDIYPAVYPFFDIYRTGNASMSEYWREPHPLKLIAKYPAFDNYPPVYPFFDIYNSGLTSDLVPLTKEALVRLEANYPVFDIYPAVYPHFQLYPAKQPVTQMTSSGFPDGHPVPANVSIYVQCRPHRTHKELHDLVFPNASASVATAGGLSLPPSQFSRSKLPSEVRRTLSLGRTSKPSLDSASGMSRSGSLRQTPVAAGNTTQMVRPSQRNNHIGRKSDIADESTPKSKSRLDGTVLERARHWQQVESFRLTMNDLSEFPMPLMPALPELPNKQLGNSVNRPVAKLDRKKFPFH